MNISHQSLTRTAMLALLLSTSAVALPACASSDAKPQPQPPMAAVGAPSDKMAQGVETRIKTLHDSIGVTADQEESFQPVAQTMRDNEAAIAQLVGTRKANSTSMTALDDMKSYQTISQAHADGVAKFLGAFEPFYNGLTDAQKKKADAFFGTFQMHDHDMKHHRQHGDHKKPMAKTAPSTPAAAQ